MVRQKCLTRPFKDICEKLYTTTCFAGWSFYHEWSGGTTRPFHHRLNSTPFDVVYVQAQLEAIAYQVGDSRIAAVDEELTLLQKWLKELMRNLQAAHDQMKKYVDLKRMPFKFEEGEWVWLKLQPY